MNEPNDKRSVPLTIWMTEAESAQLDRLREQTGRVVAGVKLPLVRRAVLGREMLVLGLQVFEQRLSQSESFPAHSPPAGKVQRRARGSGKATNVIKLKQSA